MAITNISIHEDNKVGDSDLLAVQSPLAFLVDVTYTGAIPDVLYCDVYDEDSVLLSTFKCIPYQDLLETERRFIFIADSILRGYMDVFDDFVQTVGSFVYVDGITKIFELKFRDPDEGVPDESIIFTAIHASKEFGENPNLSEIFNNESQSYLAPKDGVVYVYFYNDDTSNQVSVNGELLTLDPDVLEIIIGGSSEVIAVTSNGSWIASETESWLSLTSPSGTNDGSFTIIVDANATGLQRTGIVTVTQGTLIKTITVNQATASLAVTYDFDETINEDVDTEIDYEAWRLVDVLPLNRTGVNIKVKLDYYLHIFSAGKGYGSVYYGIGSDAVTEPTTWIIIDIALNTDIGGTQTKSGSIEIELADGEFLFIRNELSITLSVTDTATVDLDLVDGSIVAPGEGTAIASGSPLDWDKTITGGI